MLSCLVLIGHFSGLLAHAAHVSHLIVIFNVVGHHHLIQLCQCISLQQL